MSEQTPEFGGHVAGRAAGNSRGLDNATDRLEKEINRFADTLEKFNSQMPKVGGGSGGQQSSNPNGGGATFSAGAPTSHRYEGSHAATGPTSHRSGASTQTPLASGRHRGPGYLAQHGGGIAKGAAGGLLGAGAVFTANHYDNQTAGSTLAMMSAGSDWGSAYQNGALSNYTAHGDKDHWATISGMVQRSGESMGSSGWKSLSAKVQSYSAVNPAMSNQASLAGIEQATSVGSINRMNAIGINPLGQDGKGDPRSIARQILSRMGSARVKTKAQADAAFAPNGSATVTLDNYVANGYMQPGTRESVMSEMRRILYAQVNGMEFAEYNRLSIAAGAGAQTDAGKAAIDKLDLAGISTKTLPQKTAGKQGLARDSEGETIEGFVKGVSVATDTLELFRGALNKILGIGKIGEVFGLASGTGAVLPNPFSLGGGVPGGDGPSSMSSYAANFGAASGAAAARPGFGTGGLGGGGGGGSFRAASGSRAGSGSTGSASSAASSYGLGAVKPWVAKAAGTLGPKFGIKTILGVGSRGNVSDHPKGLALDFMCSKSAGDGLAAYCVANHKALNITYIIWRQRIWSINNPGWRSMEDRGSPTANHMDHVHVSFLASPINGDFSDMGGGGGLGQGLGSATTATSIGSAASAPNNGASAAGGYSEAAALGLGSSGYGIAGAGSGGGGIAGAGGSGRDNAYTNSMSSGIKGNYGSAGGPGQLRVGTFNALFTNTAARTAADFKKISGKADVIGWQEMHSKHAADFSRWMNKNTNWKYYGSKGGDTAVSWNTDKYNALQKGTFDILDRMNSKSGVRNIPSSSAYVLLQDKDSGSKFWAVSNHLQAHATTRGGEWAKTQKTQLAQLKTLYDRLKKTGIPVINVGDWNNAGLNLGGDKYGSGIDKIFAQGANITGGGSIGAGKTNSDHPFLYANVSLPGGKSAGNGGSVQQNIALGRQMAAQRGWTGAQWSSLQQLWMKESGWRTDADNPSSSAYGIPQALTELHGLGDKYKNDPKTQIQWGLNYISGRYGNPSNAMAFWKKNNYYKSGAWNVSEDQSADIHQGEMVLSAKVASAVRSEITGNRKSGPSGGGVVFQPGSIVIHVSGGAGSKAMASAGRQVVDAIVEDSRFKALAEGM